MKISTNKIIYTLISIFVILLAWEILVLVKNEPSIFPHITDIFISTINKFNKDNLIIILNTLFRTIISVLIVMFISFIISFLYIVNKNTLSFFTPFISIMRSTPLAVLSIFIFLLLDKIAPYIITILVILPVAIEGITTSISNIDKNLLDDAKLNSPSLFKTIIYVYIPLIKNYLIMVFVQIFGLGIKVMVMGEFICYTKNSIGKELSVLKYINELPDLISWGIIIVLLVAIIELIIKKIIQRQQRLINEAKQKA